MTVYFFDSSAIVKRYLPEFGTAWVSQLCGVASGNTIAVGAITAVEVAAALAARHRAPGGLSQLARDNALRLFLQHFEQEYVIADIDRATLGRAVDLTQRHRLRGYDAVQLATALAANELLTTANLPGLTFISADTALLVAARVEGLPTDDPNRHR